MKIWIIYDSNFGHCKKIAETLADILEGECDTDVGYAKKISPEDVIAEAPYAVIVGGPIHLGYPSQVIVKWIKNCYKIIRKLESGIEKGAAFFTWSVTPNCERQWRNLFNKFPFAFEFFPQVLSMKVPPPVPLLNSKDHGQLNNFGEELRKFFGHSKGV